MLCEFIVHCYSGPGSQYAHFLRFQIDGFLRFPPKKIELMLTVIYPDDDRPTHDVLEEYRWPAERVLMLRPCPRPRLQALKRPIGRNERALHTRADYCWFGDSDYVALDGCLDSLADLTGGPLWFPRTTLICRDHVTGDAYLSRMPPIDTADFEPRPERKAIGGIQIVTGDTARKHGYAQDRRSQRPAAPGTDTVVGFEADARFRKSLGTEGQAANIPNCYRIRHSVCGDDRAIKAGIPQPGEA